MRSVKVGASRQPENREKPPTGRKPPTIPKITLQSAQGHPFEAQKPETREELEEYRQLFNMFDTDGSGAIGNEELKQAMFSIGMQANKAEIDNVIKEFDADGNGEIDFEEFCACMKKSRSILKSTNEELIRECFEIFDQDHNGVITESEFKTGKGEFKMPHVLICFIPTGVHPTQTASQTHPISSAEYVAKEYGDFTDELAEKVFRELDVSANGHLSADQFATVVEEYLLSDRSRADSERE